jgi:hypothetical protein
MSSAFKDDLISGDWQHDSYWSAVSDLVSLIERTRTRERSRELAMQAEAASTNSDDILVLDDISLPEMTESAGLKDCNLRLREALYFLLEARPACGSPCCSKQQSKMASTSAFLGSQPRSSITPG